MYAWVNKISTEIVEIGLRDIPTIPPAKSKNKEAPSMPIIKHIAGVYEFVKTKFLDTKSGYCHICF